MIVATCTGAPLLTELVVMTAVKSSAVTGVVEKVTVNVVAVAVVTVPTAPLLKATVLLLGVLSKPKPLMVIVVALAIKSDVLLVTTGAKKATCTAVPLLTPLVVMIAVKLPAALGPFDNETDNIVAVAAVTAPIAPLLNAMVLLPAVVSNPSPLMVSVVVFASSRYPEFAITTGLTAATCTAEPLLMPFEVTTAVKLPAARGFLENVTVRDVADADVTVPIAPLLKSTLLFAAVRSKPNPVMITVLALEDKFVVVLVTTGVTVAI